MFEHILVPLDGSSLAEAAVAPAAVLAQRLGSDVTLLHVIEKNAPETIHGQTHLTNDEDACRYLDQVVERNFDREIRVMTHVHTEEVSQVSQSIVEHSVEFKPDLIVMSAHGEGGFHDFVVGSIPQQVISAGEIPVLLLQPETGNEYRDIQFNRFMVALDGNPAHEISLEAAGKLAVKLGAILHLIRIVPTLATLSAQDAASGTLLPAATSAMLEIAEEEACDYLREKLDWLAAQKIIAVAEVGRGDPAVEVVTSAEDHEVDIIILATHGRKGMDAFWTGSVAPQIVSRTHRPLLLVPVEG